MVFTKGHKINVGRMCSNNTKEKIRKVNIGHKVSDTAKYKMSVAKKGKPNWKKGLIKETDTRVKKCSDTMLHKFNVLGIKNNMFGKKQSDYQKRVVSENQIGDKNCMFRKGYLVKGKLNPNWRGGTSFEFYPPEFNKKLKLLIKERDNFECHICKTKNKLVIHHINFIKKDCRPENLITLCNKCHGKMTPKNILKMKFKKHGDFLK